jgi:hypothetical protein
VRSHGPRVVLFEAFFPEQTDASGHGTVRLYPQNGASDIVFCYIRSIIFPIVDVVCRSLLFFVISRFYILPATGGNGSTVD